MQKEIHFIIIFSSILLTVQNSIHSTQFNLIGTLNESQSWNIRSQFFPQGDNLQFTLESDPNFSLLLPLHQLGTSTLLKRMTGSILSSKAYTQEDKLQWKNRFAFLHQDAQNIDMFFDNNMNNFNKNQVPSFKTQITISDDPTVRCLDFDYLTQNRLIVDCYQIKATNIQNIFYIIEIQSSTYTIDSYPNTLEQELKSRKLTYHSDGYLYRAELSQYNQLDGSIQVFAFNSGRPSIVDTLTSEKYQQLTQSNSFILLDYKCLADQLYILDKDYKIVVLQYSQSEWKLLKIINLDFIPYAFDVALKDQITIYTVLGLNLLWINQDGAIFKRTLDLEFDIQTQVQLNGNLILLRNATTLYLNNFQNSIDSIQIPELQDIIFSHLDNQPYLITLTKERCTSYLLNEGTLQFKGSQITQQLKSIKLYANQSYKTIRYEVLEVQDATIRAFKQFLSNPSSEFSQSLFIDDEVSGPNLLFKQSPDSDFSLSQKLFDKYVLTNQLPEGIQYSQIYQISETQFQLKLQFQDKVFYSLLCEIKQQVSCLIQDQYQLPTLIQIKNYGFQRKSNSYIHILPISDFSINILKRENKVSTIIQSIIFDSTNTDNKITSISVDQENVYVIQSLKNQITRYNLNDQSYSLVINETFLKNAGISVTFTPLRVFQNTVLHPNLIIFQTKTQLIIASLIDQDIFPFKVLEQTQQNIEIVISANTFTIVEQREDNTFDKYDISNYQNIYKKQQIPLYGFRINEPIIVSYSSLSDKYILYAQNSITKENTLLIYEMESLNHQQLFRTIKVDEIQAISADGEDSQLFYLFTNGQHTIYYLNGNHNLQYIARQSNEYITDQVISFSISNEIQESSVEIQQKLKVQNSQSQIEVNEIQLIQVKNQIQEQIIDLGTTWFKGKVIDFDCLSCDSYLRVESPLFNVEQDIIIQQQGKPFLFRNNRLVYVEGDVVKFYTLDGILDYEVKFIKLQFATCHVSNADQDNQFLFIGCQFEGLAYINILECQEFCNNYQQGFMQLPNKFNRGVGKIQKWNDFIFVLDQSEANLEDKQSSIHIYQMFSSIKVDSYYLELIHSIQYNEVQPLKSFSLADFELIYFEEYQQLLVLTAEASIGLYGEYFYFNKFKTTLTYVGSAFKYLSDELIQQGIMLEQPMFVMINLIQQNRLVDDYYHHEILITTDTQGSYLLNLGFQATSSELDVPLYLRSIDVIFILSEYGGHNVYLNRNTNILTLDRYVALPYYNGVEIIVGVYKLPKLNNQHNELLNWIGGYTMSVNNLEQLMVSLLVSNTLDNYLIALEGHSDQMNIRKLRIQDTPKLVVSSAAQYDGHNLQVKLSNGFTEGMLSTYIKVKFQVDE